MVFYNSRVDFITSLDNFLKFLPVFVRSASFMLALPVISSPFIHPMVAISIPLWVSIAIHGGVNIGPLPTNLGDLLLGVVGEVTLGILIALFIRLFFVAPQIAGEVLGFQMGFGISNVVSPITEIPLTIVADFFYLFGLLLFFLLDIHHFFLVGLKESFEVIPPFFVGYTEGAHGLIMSEFSKAFSVAVKLASPVLVPIFIMEIAMALISKTIPQINIFVVGFPLRVALGLLTISIFFPVIGFLIGEFLKVAGKDFLRLILLLH